MTRAAIAAALVLAMAVTPLSALINPRQFEVQFARGYGSFARALTLTLDDRTGLVRALAVAAVPMGVTDPVINLGADDRVLIVTIDGSSCDVLTTLVLVQTAAGYNISARTLEGDCAIGTGMGRSVALSLWAPIDAATVTLVELD